ncbi:MAG: hypothetical protein M3277_06735 [Actinomycetota bacterium]|nr:hypothetical protein [Actinomycetota bacterium]
MTNPLHGCDLKLKRAEEHRKAFKAEVEEFFEGDPYAITLKRNPQTGKDRVLIEPKRPLPGVRWGTLVGDCVHNLRSALDQMVWVLTCANGNIPPNPVPRGDKWRKIAFPIYEEPPFRDGFGGEVPWEPGKPKCLWGVNQAFATAFHQLQPYQHGTDTKRQALWVLNELWSIDKHRTINVVGVGTERVVLGLLPEHGTTFTFEVEGYIRFEDGASLGEIPAGWVDVNVPPTIRFRTFFAEGQAFDTMPVLETLGLLYEAVAEVLKGAAYALPILHPDTFD